MLFLLTCLIGQRHLGCESRRSLFTGKQLWQADNLGNPDSRERRNRFGSNDLCQEFSHKWRCPTSINCPLWGLDLFDAQVTDAGLVHLKGLTQLQELYLVDTKVTDEGVKKLQQALPNCKIRR